MLFGSHSDKQQNMFACSQHFQDTGHSKSCTSVDTWDCWGSFKYICYFAKKSYYWRSCLNCIIYFKVMGAKANTNDKNVKCCTGCWNLIKLKYKIIPSYLEEVLSSLFSEIAIEYHRMRDSCWNNLLFGTLSYSDSMLTFGFWHVYCFHGCHATLVR